MLDKSICHFRDVRSSWFFFLWRLLLANNVGPNQMSHDVVSDLGLQFLPMTLMGFPIRMG